MKHIYVLLSSFLLLFLFLSSSCEPDPLEPKDCGLGQCTYSYADSAKINYDGTTNPTNYSLEDGDLRVFAYVFVKEGTGGEVNGHKEFLNFEVGLDEDDFSFSDTELPTLTMTLMYQECVRCITKVYTPISGSVSGKRKNDRIFKIELDLLFDIEGTNHEIKIDEKYILDA